MKKFAGILICYAVIPFFASILTFALLICRAPGRISMFTVPAAVSVIYILLQKKLDMRLAAVINGFILLILPVCFTILMAVASGSIGGVVVSRFMLLILPFLPVMFMLTLMGASEILYLTVFLSYMAAAAVSLFLSENRPKLREMIVPCAVLLVCTAVCSVLYINRPEAKYSGHGFDYMHGYSSTDMSDYTVYSENSRLVSLDHRPSFMIENEEDMPVMDGAEACYPLYAAVAKAVYKDIDKIEKSWEETASGNYQNGKIVTFTNTIVGFERLIQGGSDQEKLGGGVDLFFGARPSEEQSFWAEEMGVEPEITTIGREAFVFFVEEDNPIDDLTSAQIKKIYHGDITNWREVGGRDEEIIAFQRPANSGSQTMMEYFMGDISLKEPKTYEKIDSMAGVIRNVAQYANEDGALGYSFRYFLEELGQEKGVKLLSVDGVCPSLENIENGSYPLTVSLCLVTRKNDTNPYVQKMIEFMLSEDGQYIVRNTGYAGLPEQKPE